MNSQKISIALCTFNGEEYLAQQLDSILNQIRLPDELIICDDLSSDNTINILENFEIKAPFLVKIFVNDFNLGSTKNFEKAISLCSGDLIALADQDDLWLPRKLIDIEQLFIDNPAVGMVFTDAEVVNEASISLGYTLWQYGKFGRKERQTISAEYSSSIFKMLVRKNVVTGATMCFRSEFRSTFIPIPTTWVHDHWIAVMLSLKTKISLINMPLIKYRQHSNQQIGAKKRSLLATIEMIDHIIKPKNGVSFYELEVQKAYDLQERLVADGAEIKLQIFTAEKLNHEQARMRGSKSGLFQGYIIIFLQLLLQGYHKYDNGLSTTGKDLLAMWRRHKLN
jgi:glycosyltransferase involved in cell wall biosynthesis